MRFAKRSGPLLVISDIIRGKCTTSTPIPSTDIGVRSEEIQLVTRWKQERSSVAVHVFRQATRSVGLLATTMASGKQDGDAALLAILQSHGQQFLADFGDTSFIQGPSKKRKLDLKADFESDRDDGSGTEDEWAGFGDGEGISDTEEGEESAYI